MNYKTVQDAAIGLLIESVEIAKESKLDFCVVGGWSPYIRNSKPIPHPGTKDVDLLFRKGENPGSLRSAIELFLENSYLLSAKHEFQLLRTLQVNGKPFVFNVDFLHPLETIEVMEMMVDQMDLDVLECQERHENRMAKSIALPASDFVFDGHVVMEKINGFLPVSGDESISSVPIIDEVGVFVTKFQSVTNQKRPRDAFDIFVALTQAQNQELVLKGIQNIRAKFDGIDELTRKFIKYLRKDPKDGFQKNVCRFSNAMGYKVENPKKTILGLLK